jgi:hypothetical protein
MSASRKRACPDKARGETSRRDAEGERKELNLLCVPASLREEICVSAFPDVEGDGIKFLVIDVKDEVYDTTVLEVEVGNGKHEVRYRGGVPHTFYVNTAVDWLYVHLAVEIASFYPETVFEKFPDIKSNADNH